MAIRSRIADRRDPGNAEMLAPLSKAIDTSAIHGLVSNGVREGQHLDDKEKLPGLTSADKKSFLKDGAAFANSGGGDLLFGLVEHRDAKGKPTGIPETACGLAGINSDAELLRLDSMIRDGISPRIAVKTAVISGFNFRLGIDDIRSAFGASSDAVERASRLRDSRISAIVSGETPVKTQGGSLLVLVVPQGQARTLHESTLGTHRGI